MTVALDRDVDDDVLGLTARGWSAAGQPVHPERRRSGEHGWFQRQDAAQAQLNPQEWTGVVDVDARVDDRPLPTTHESFDVVVVQSCCPDLTTRDHTSLRSECTVDGHGFHAMTLTSWAGTRMLASAGCGPTRLATGGCGQASWRWQPTAVRVCASAVDHRRLVPVIHRTDARRRGIAAASLHELRQS